MEEPDDLLKEAIRQGEELLEKAEAVNRALDDVRRARERLPKDVQ